MDAISIWRTFSTKIDKASNGNISVPEFVTLFNSESLLYFRECVGGEGQYSQGIPLALKSPDSGIRQINKLSPFFKHKIEPVTNGICTMNYPDFGFGPWLYTLGFVNPNSCGDEPQEQYDMPFEGKSESEWGNAIRSGYRKPSLKFPVFRVIDNITLEIAPKSINYVKIRYLRLPSPLVIFTIQNSTEPDPSAANVSPEWNDIDIEAIILRTMTAAGVKEQTPVWNQQRKENDR